MSKLPCTLEELHAGTTKRLKVTRTVTKSDGSSEKVPEVLTVEVRPGWKAGTKVTFEGKGDERPGRLPADIQFVIEEKPHPRFTRVGDNLQTTMHVNLRDALCGVNLSVAGIDRVVYPLRVDDVVSPGEYRVVRGAGMPKKGGGHGDLVVKFDVVFPKRLSAEQKRRVAEALDS